MKNENTGSLKRIVLLSVLLILLAIAVYFIIIFILSIRPPEGNPTLSLNTSDNGMDSNSTGLLRSENEDEIYNFLIAGLDQLSANTDTIMVVSLNVTSKKMNILNIPRDTMVDTERKVKKINAAYEAGGIKQLEQEAASILGFFVNRYALVNIDGVEKIVDALGGIDIYVPRNMNYDDPTQNLHIHFKKGQQHLNGEQVVKLARFRRYTNGDIDRISMQHEVLKALAEQALQAKNLTKLPKLIELFMENVETDITAGQMLWLANQAKDISLDEIKMSMVPGKADMVDGLSYWIPDKEELLTIINDEMYPSSYPINEVNTVSLPNSGG